MGKQLRAGISVHGARENSWGRIGNPSPLATTPLLLFRGKRQRLSIGLRAAWDQDPTRRRLSIGSARTAASPGSSPASPFRRTSVRRMMRL